MAEIVPQQVIVTPTGDLIYIAGSDLAARYPQALASARPIDVLGEMVREPCIVCGHPTGDCTGHE